MAYVLTLTKLAGVDGEESLEGVYLEGDFEGEGEGVDLAGEGLNLGVFFASVEAVDLA